VIQVVLPEHGGVPGRFELGLPRQLTEVGLEPGGSVHHRGPDTERRRGADRTTGLGQDGVGTGDLDASTAFDQFVSSELQSPEALHAGSFVALHEQRLVSENDSTNDTMLHFNERLGFVKEPAWIVYEQTAAS
jgi:hypothetical protein